MNMILWVSNEIMHVFSYIKHMNMLFIEIRACVYIYIKEYEAAESMRFTWKLWECWVLAMSLWNAWWLIDTCIHGFSEKHGVIWFQERFENKLVWKACGLILKLEIEFSMLMMWDLETVNLWIINKMFPKYVWCFINFEKGPQCSRTRRRHCGQSEL